jgi:hypothetical protein
MFATTYKTTWCHNPKDHDEKSQGRLSALEIQSYLNMAMLTVNSFEPNIAALWLAHLLFRRHPV